MTNITLSQALDGFLLPKETQGPCRTPCATIAWRYIASAVPRFTIAACDPPAHGEKMIHSTITRMRRRATSRFFCAASASNRLLYRSANASH